MAARGVYFALTDADSDALLGAKDDDDLAEMIEEIEERWDRDWLEEADKAWDAIHRCLTDGTLSGDSPPDRALCVLGGRDLYDGDDYFAVYINPGEVARVDAAIRGIDQAWLRARYDQLSATDYDGPIGEDDAQYTWTYFMDVQKLFAKAAKAGRAMLFTVDQ